MFSINLNAICFDFARQSHIERFTPTIYAEALYISNLYTMTIDIPRSGRRRARDVAPPMSPEGAPSRNRPVADNSAADMPSSRSSSSTTLTATARLSGRAGVWTGAAVGRIGRKVLCTDRCQRARLHGKIRMDSRPLRLHRASLDLLSTRSKRCVQSKHPTLCMPVNLCS